MSSRMCRGNKISLTLFGASSPDYHPCCSLKKCTLPYTYFVFKCLVLYFGIKQEWLENQRTNGPVNAHLRSAAYTNKHV